MKRFITAAAAVILTITFSHNAFAHSHLGGSNPEDGEVVKEPLDEIVLEFDGKIEEGSYIEVETKSGKDVEIQDIVISDGKLTGTFAKNLSNDEYEVNWNIISGDGHSLDGDFEFTVDAPIANNGEVSENGDDTSEVNNQTYDVQEKSNTEEVDEDSTSTTIMIIVLLVVILAGGFFFIKRRK